VDETSVSINLGVEVAIPDDYISDMGQRLRTYKRVSSARDEETLSAVRAETEDRYGRIPPSVARLFDYARLRRLAEDLKVISIDRIPAGVAIKLSEKADVAPEKLAAFLKMRGERATFTPSGILRIQLQEEEAEEILPIVRRALLDIRAGQ
jgi:transcription-repair coupling factor (superfamily II helicase)